SIVPVILVGGFFTAADAPVLRVAVGVAALAVAMLPVMLMGAAIGYSMPFTAAIAVIQIAMFGMAFLRGRFLPPTMFADWLDGISKLTPTRQGRELVIWAVQGGTLEWWVWAGLAVWTVLLLALALLLFRRDEGHRYR